MAQVAQTKWIRPVEWVRQTGMSKRETYRRIYSGELKAVRIDRMWFIEASELIDFFERFGEAVA